jgi:RimJ/RimL family protein N-acetyltransferase
MTAWVAEALCRRDEGADLPFVIQDCMQNRIIGETRLIDYVPEHRQIEIAWTWFAPHMWGQGYGTESKLILLRYCFEKLKVIRVRITSHSSNARSRQHLEHIGATLEGILRQDRIMPDGQVRDTAYYSVIADEWPQVERRINEILRKY